jgi:two-component system, OmpR family, sensor kinase
MSGVRETTTTTRTSRRWTGIATRSLVARLVVSAVLVALLGAGVTLGVAYQLVRSVTITQSRDVLRSTARVVAQAPPKDRAALVRRLDRAKARGVHLVLVRKDGVAIPDDVPVPSGTVQAVEANGRVSARFSSGGATYLIEGVRVSQGDAVIAVQDFALIHATTLRLFDRFLLAAGIGAALAAVLGAVVAARISRPLRRSSAFARGLAAGRRGLPAPPATDLAELASIDSALTTLDSALRSSEASQREFLLSVSHEIRTPLTGIRGYADALADGLVAPEAVPGAGRTLAAETRRLDAFLGDLLELARLQADDFSIRVQHFDLAELVGQSLRAWAPTADRAGIRLESAVPTFVMASDPVRVRQLLDGLFENAMRASPQGTLVQVRATPDVLVLRPAVRIDVVDQGPGLSDVDAAEAFERGRLADRYRTTRQVGTGLGLSIAARLVRRLGGRIEATAGTSGAVFTIRLPVDATPHSAATAEG